MRKAKKTAKPKTQTKGKSKTTAKPKAQSQPKAKEAKATPKSTVSLETLVAEIERISSKLDSIEKDVRKLKGVAYPIG